MDRHFAPFYENIEDQTIYDGLIEAAVILRNIGNKKDTINLLNKASKLIKQAPTALIRVGIEFEKLGEYEKAEVMFKQAHQVNPLDREVKKSYGLFLVSRNRIPEGLELLCQYIRAGNWSNIEILEIIDEKGREVKFPGVKNTLKLAWHKTLNHKIGYRYSLFAFKEGNFEEALPILELIANQTEKDEYYNLLGISLYNLNRDVEAIEALKKAISSVKRFIEYAEYEGEDYESVEDEYNQKMLSLGRYHGNLAHLFNKVHEWDKALEQADLAFKITDNEHSVEKKIEALVGLHRFREASSLAQKIINQSNASQEDLSNFYLLGLKALLGQDEKDQSIKLFDKAIKKYSDLEEFYRIFASYLIENKLFEDADAILAKAEVSNIKEVDKAYLSYDRYILLHRLGLPDKAWEVLRPYSENLDWAKKLENRDFRDANPEELLRLRLEILGVRWMEFNVEEISDRNLLKTMNTQLLSHFPNDPGFFAYDIYYAFLEKNLNYAEAQLRSAMSLANNFYESLFVNNLGYLLIINGKLDEAIRVLATDVKGFPNDFGDFLHELDKPFSYKFAIFRKGKIESHPAERPDLGIPYEIARSANLVAACLKNKDIHKATSQVFSMLDYSIAIDQGQTPTYNMDDIHFVNYLAQGSVELAKSQVDAARITWIKALDLVKEGRIGPSAHHSSLEQWINEIGE